ncbi:hypothetical protein NKG94_33265 [Micromonospora sp. M12]
MSAAAAANALSTFLVDSAAAGACRRASPAHPDPGQCDLRGGRVGAGWLADRRDTGHVALIAAMLVVGAAGLGLLALGGSVPLVAGVVLGFGLGWAWPGLMTFAVVRLHPQSPAAATSITQTGVYAGGCLGPLSLGPLAAHLGYPAMWTIAAGAMLLAAALMLVGSRLLTRAAARVGRGVEDQLVRSAM